MRSNRTILSAIGLLLVASPAAAGPAESDKARVDTHGDPLPAGAIARLGTIRFRVGGLVFACAFSPDGKIIAAGSTDKAIRLFDAATGRPIRELHGHKNDVTCLSYSPDGRLLASGCLDGTICLHDPAIGKIVRRFSHKQDRIWGLAFTPDGKMLVTGGGSQDWKCKEFPVRIWDPGTGKEIRALDGHTTPIRALAVSPDGKLLASASKTTFDPNEDGVIRLWEPATGKLLRALKGQRYGTFALVFSPDSKRLASGNHDGTVWLWDAASGKVLRRLQANGGALSLAFSPDGKLLAAGSKSWGLYLWDASTGEKLYRIDGQSFSSTVNAHPGGIPCLAFSPDGRTLVYGEDEVLKALDSRGWKEKSPFPAHRNTVRQVYFSSGGEALLTLGDDGQLLRWNLPTGRARSLLPGKKRFTSADRVALSPDHKVLAGWDGPEIHLWNTATGIDIRTIPLFDKKPNGGWTTGMARFSPDGKLLAGTIPDRSLISMWDTADGKEVARLEKYREQPHQWVGRSPCLCFSLDGRMLASTSSNERAIWLHDTRTGKFLRELRAGESEHISLAFSPDGRMLATVLFSDNSIHIWELKTGGERLRLDCNQLSPVALAFTGNSRWLAVTGWDYTVGVWDVLAGKEVGCLRGHDGGAASVAFSPGDRLLATGGRDTTVLLWDMKDLFIHKKVTPIRLAAVDREALWADLAHEDAARAYQTMRWLTQYLPEPVAFVKDHLKPARPARDPAFVRLLRDLDSNRFEVREKAEAELLKMGESIEAALQQALADRPSLETRRRIERLLDKLRGRIVRASRAVEVLERIGDAGARNLLIELAKGAAELDLTREATASLARLDKGRPSK